MQTTLSAADATQLEAALHADLDAIALMKTIQGIVTTATAAGVTRSAVAAAVQAHGEDGAMAALGLSRLQAAQLNSEIGGRLATLKGRYPALAQLIAGTATMAARDDYPSCSESDVSGCDESSANCAWVSLTIALGLCTGSGPLYEA